MIRTLCNCSGTHNTFFSLREGHTVFQCEEKSIHNNLTTTEPCTYNNTQETMTGISKIYLSAYALHCTQVSGGLSCHIFPL